MSYRLGFGPPFEPEHRVRVVAAIDQTVHDVSRFIGQTGTVRRLVIDGHCGETLEDGGRARRRRRRVVLARRTGGRVTLALCKYVGSKVDLLASSAHMFPVPDHGGKVLVPFVGGGSVAAFYAARGYKVIASDINPRLVNAHIEVQRDAEAVIEVLAVLARTLRSVDREGMADLAGRAFFEEQRDRLSAHFEHGASDAARFLFVIRAGFNGLWRENAAGECTTAYGKPEPNRDLVQADSLRAYSAAIQGVEFLCEDFAVTCGRAKPSDAVYLDSPYEGTFTGYAGGDWNASQACLPGMGRVSERDRLAAMLVYLDAIGARWSNSDADCATTRRLYARWWHESVSRSGRVNSDGEGRGAVVEGLWRNWQ